MRGLLFILTALTVALAGRAQLCTGSLGDPVVKKTFGAGNNPGPVLNAATTNYLFTNTDCPPDGSYTVRNHTSGCFNNSWFTVNGHTGDPNGYFMLVNANYTPGDFYVDTVHGLCTNTTYEFAAWIVNVLLPSACGGQGINPNLTFKIEQTDGTVLASYSTGNIPQSSAPNWQQYGLFFQTTAATTTVVVRITNNAPGGCGNDLGLDDITFRPCGPLVNASLTITGDTSKTICVDDTSSMQLGSSFGPGYNNPVFQWQLSVNGGNFQDIPGATGTAYLRKATGPGQYIYRLTMAETTNAGFINCRVASNTVDITINPLPVPLLADTTSACTGTNDSLQAKGGTAYSWTGPNGFISTLQVNQFPNIQPSVAGLYKVKVVDNNGCSAMDSTRLVVYPAVTATATGDGTICEGSGGQQLLANGGVKYVWTPIGGLTNSNTADPFASPIDTTVYKVIVYSQYGCSDSAFVTVNVWKMPVANAGPDKKTKEGIPVVLNGVAYGTDVSYYWSPPTYLSDPNVLTPIANPPSDMTYTLYVTSDHGCGVSTDQMFIRVYKQIKIPNAFSPNGDGINDTWNIEALNTYPDADLQVFNRYGQLVFQCKGYSKPWDGTLNGKPLPVGTYYYVIDLKTDVYPKPSGWVFIIR